MKIAIAGTRGIPNRYGGFEQFAEYLSAGLAAKGAEVYVYCPSDHEFNGDEWNGAQIIRKYCPSVLPQWLSQMVYDLLCILDSRRRGFDIVYQLGYTSSSIWFTLHTVHTMVITNMDGIEWKRKKYNRLASKFLSYAESRAVKHSQHLIADSMQIKQYLQARYGREATYISYGAECSGEIPPLISSSLPFETAKYCLAIARFQPDNNLEVIIYGFLRSGNNGSLVLIGDFHNRYGRYLRKKYQDPRIVFYGSLYDSDVLDRLRAHATVYFHGHSAGGTNPSLLEAMAAGALICAHDNPFNREVLGVNAFYFNNENNIADLLKNLGDTGEYREMVEENRQAIKNTFGRSAVIEKYFDFFDTLLQRK